MKNILSELLSQTRRQSPTPLALGQFNFFLAFVLPAVILAGGGEIIKLNDISPYRMKTVVIDAGHGGHDPGCLGSDSREKHITLAVAKRLAAAIQSTHPDLRVILTRDTDVFIPLHERAAIANRNQADLFISIHCNFMPGKASVQGSETYVMGLHTAEHNLAVAKRENASILLEENYEAHYDYDPNSPEGHITLSMFQSAFIEHSILFADFVEKQFALAGRKSRGVRQAGFVVLKASAMPSALIEIGYLSNREEEIFLKSEEGQAAVTNAILNAFTQFRGYLEGVTVPVAYASNPKNAPQEPKPVSTKSAEIPASPAKPEPGQASESAKAEGIPLGNISKGSSNTPSSPPAPKSTWPEIDTPRIKPAGTPVPASYEPASAPLPQQSRGQPAGAVHFCIQLAAASTPADINQASWKNIGYKVEEVREDGKYKYQIRYLPTYEQAHEIRLKALSGGFPGAFIVAYKNDRRIPIEEAMRASN